MKVEEKKGKGPKLGGGGESKWGEKEEKEENLSERVSSQRMPTLLFNLLSFLP